MGRKQTCFLFTPRARCAAPAGALSGSFVILWGDCFVIVSAGVDSVIYSSILLRPCFFFRGAENNHFFRGVGVGRLVVYAGCDDGK